jgi:plastocyanin domain-containing protein
MNSGKIFGIIGIILIGVFLVVAGKNIFSSKNIDGNVVIDDENNGGEQVVELGMKNYNYYPNIINLKYNVPAKIVVKTDEVKGCLRSIVIPDFNVKKLIKTNDNIISFTPNKIGTFSFSCSMGMGFGKIIVN